MVKQLKIGGLTMPLTNKCLKYSPEITLEIFKLVYNKLIELKWAPKEMESARTLWKEFNVYPFLCDLGYGGMKLFGTFSAARHSDSETTVQEILGYDPYVKGCISSYDLSIERDWSKASKEELLEEAKRRYPIGCKINSIKGNGKNLTIIKDNFTIHNKDCKIGITVSTDYANGIIVKNGCSIFIDNQWAEIISLPEAKVEVKEEVKQPLKQAVHCKTQEEYKFAKETLGATFNPNAYIAGESIIPLDAVGSTINLNRFGHSVYSDFKLLSFQEWCDLNGYKMENKSEFKVGDWVCKECSDGNIIYQVEKIMSDGWLNGKIFGGGWNKKILRHATPEEINNHLISIRQIPVGEPLNTGIEPNKDGMFKYTTGNSYNKEFSTSFIPIKLEIELNYLPEPK